MTPPYILFGHKVASGEIRAQQKSNDSCYVKQGEGIILIFNFRQSIVSRWLGGWFGGFALASSRRHCSELESLRKRRPILKTRCTGYYIILPYLSLGTGALVRSLL